MYIPASGSRAKFRLPARSAGIIKPGAAIIPRSSVAGPFVCHPSSSPVARERFLFLHFLLPAGKTRPTPRNTCYSSNYATCRRDRTARQHEKPFVVGLWPREFVAVERTGGQILGERARTRKEGARWRRGHEGVFEGTSGALALRMHPWNPFLAYIHFRCDEMERIRKRERDGARETGLVAGEKRDRGERRRQLGQTLNNLDNGRTALNSCRFVQAHRLIRLAGRLQCGRGGEGGMGRGPGEFSVPP